MPVPMMQDHPRNSVLESWYMRALDRLLATLAENFSLRSNAAAPLTTIEVPAGAGRSDGLPASISIGGKWRWTETAVTRAHPGGAAGTYIIYVVAANNVIVNTPLPYTDNTNYGFELRIVASPGTPTLVPGTVDVYRRVGTLEWDGAKITKLDQEIGDLTQGSGVRSFTVGDGVATNFVVNHGLGTRFVAVTAFRNVAPYDEVDVTVEHTDGDNVTVRVEGVVPALNELNLYVAARAANLISGYVAHASSHLPGGSDVLDITSMPPVLRGASAAFQPGVLDPTDGVVTRLSAATLRVAAGKGWVPFGTGKAFVEWPQTDLAVAATAAGQQRIDSVVIVLASGGVGVPTLVGGAPVTGSATFVSNTPAVPAGSVRLADQLILPTGIDTGNFRDRRPWARGARASFVATTNNGGTNDLIFSSAGVWVPFDNAAGRSQFRLECSGAPVMWRVAGVANVAATNVMNMRPLVDGGAIDGINDAGALGPLRITGPPSASGDFPFDYTYPIQALAAGSHLFQVNAIGVFTVYVRPASFRWIFEVWEELRVSANNGTA